MVCYCLIPHKYCCLESGTQVLMDRAPLGHLCGSHHLLSAGWNGWMCWDSCLSLDLGWLSQSLSGLSGRHIESCESIECCGCSARSLEIWFYASWQNLTARLSLRSSWDGLCDPCPPPWRFPGMEQSFSGASN